MEKRKNGFTLIELIAVLVILAILAIIVTPIVLNIVKNAKDAANKRSVDAYGKTVELSVATYMLDNGEYPKCQSDLKIEYSGNEVNCNIMNLNENGSVYLSECTVGGKEVKDSSTDDGWYHYGKSSGLIEKYQSYKIGDIVTYNGMDFYVINDSDENSDYVTLLKAEPLTYDEVNAYGSGHVNMYITNDASLSYYQTAYNKNGYGGMAYYSSSTCGYPMVNSSVYVKSGCTTNYDASDIKYVVDSWSGAKLIEKDLQKDILGYKVRLITYEELLDLGYKKENYVTQANPNPDITPEWIYDSNYQYWTMSAYEDSTDNIWTISPIGIAISYSSDGRYNIHNFDLTYSGNGVYASVRPVINLKKTAFNNTDTATNLRCE